jgi:hypothetical protein
MGLILNYLRMGLSFCQSELFNKGPLVKLSKGPIDLGQETAWASDETVNWPLFTESTSKHYEPLRKPMCRKCGHKEELSLS